MKQAMAEYDEDDPLLNSYQEMRGQVWSNAETSCCSTSHSRMGVRARQCDSMSGSSGPSLAVFVNLFTIEQSAVIRMLGKLTANRMWMQINACWPYRTLIA